MAQVALFATIIDFLKDVVTVIGGILSFIGLVFFAIALKDQESSGYSKGALFVVSGAIIIGAAQLLLPMVMGTAS